MRVEAVDGQQVQVTPELAQRPETEVLPASARPRLVVVARGVRVGGCVAAVLALVVAAILLRPDAAPAAAGAGQAAGPRAVLLSGSSLSYAAGQQTGAVLGWDVEAYALPGAGFSRSNLDPAGSIVATGRRLFAGVGPPPDVVVLQGGEADHAAPLDSVETAVAHLLDYVRAHTGAGTYLVLVGPIPGGTVPMSLLRVNEVMAQAALVRDIPYVDAVTQGWQERDPALPGLLADQLAAVVPLR